MIKLIEVVDVIPSTKMIGCKNGPFQDVVHTEKNDFPLAMLLYPSKQNMLVQKTSIKFKTMSIYVVVIPIRLQNMPVLKWGNDHPHFFRGEKAKYLEINSCFWFP